MAIVDLLSTVAFFTSSNSTSLIETILILYRPPLKKKEIKDNTIEKKKQCALPCKTKSKH
jgi:hypothetical protein